MNTPMLWVFWWIPTSYGIRRIRETWRHFILLLWILESEPHWGLFAVVSDKRDLLWELSKAIFLQNRMLDLLWWPEVLLRFLFPILESKVWTFFIFFWTVTISICFCYKTCSFLFWDFELCKNLEYDIYMSHL